METFKIIAALISLNFIAAQTMSKCCPLNHELFINESNLNNITRENVFCRPTNGTILVALSSPSLTIGLPNCSKLDIVDAYRRDLKISCLDRIAQLNDVFAIRCAQNETENIHDIVTTTSLRKCCPQNRKFDWDKQYCYNQYAEDYANAATDLLKLTQNRQSHFVNLSFGTPHCRRSDVLMDKIIHRDDVQFLDTDAILINESNIPVILSFDEFCVDVVDDRFEYLVIRSCHDYITSCKHGDQVCISKCCPVGYELHDNRCIPSTRPLNLSFYNVTDKYDSQIATNVKPAFLQGSGCTGGKYQLNESEEGKRIMTTSGTIFASATNTVIDINMYCVDNVKYQPKAKIFVCVPEGKNVLSMIRELKPMLTSICAGISAFFFILTFFIYLLIPSLRNLHGQLIMSYLMSSAASYITVVVHRTLPLQVLSADICQAAGYALLFTTLSSFCWLNVISYDIWSTFKITRSTFLKKSKTCKRLLLYSLYGWGYPMLWSSFAYISQFVFKADEKQWISDIGKISCWFTDYGKSKIIYFILPISVMLVFNAIIFVTIVKYCSSVRAELYNSNNCNYSLKKYSANKNDFIINVKLFVLMGLNWSLEVIALVVQPQHRIFFIISDLLNALVGLIVFCILIMKRKVLHDLKKMICGSSWHHGTDRVTRSNVSTSSTNVQSVTVTNSRRSINRF